MDRSNNPFLATIRLPVKISPILVIAILVLHFISLFLPWLTGLEFTVKLVLTSLPVLSICFYLHQFYFKPAHRRVTELILNSEDNWQVKTDRGDSYQAVLGESLFVHPWLVIIPLTYNNHQEHFVLTPETIDSDQFRRLRVRLRFQLNKEL